MTWNSPHKDHTLVSKLGAICHFVHVGHAHACMFFVCLCFVLFFLLFFATCQASLHDANIHVPNFIFLMCFNHIMINKPSNLLLVFFLGGGSLFAPIDFFFFFFLLCRPSSMYLHAKIDTNVLLVMMPFNSWFIPALQQPIHTNENLGWAL